MQINRSRFKRLSLKGRLFLAAVLWLSAMILAAGIGIPRLVNDYLINDVKSQLNLSMDEITANIEVDKNGRLTLDSRLSDPRFNRPYSGLYWSASTDNQVLRSRSLWDRDIQVEQKGLKEIVRGAKNEKLIYISQAIYLPDFTHPVEIIIGLDEDPLEHTLTSLVSQLWIILGLLFAGVLIFVELQVRWSLRPLNKMHNELSQLRLGKRDSLEEDYPSEVSPLVSDLNALLFHYQELLERARQHAGNLSHALKTPLSVLKNDITALSDEEKQRLSVPVEQIQSQIDYHLGRARMAGSANILSVKVNPSDRVDTISMAFDKVYAQREVVLINELDTDLEVAVDPTDFDEMIGNLLENGYKWASSVIRVYSEELGNDFINIHVCDDGPGIPQQQRKHAIQRGVRLDETTPGTGLGLNIVCEMAHSYRGDLSLSDSSMGGLQATLKLKKVTKAQR
ncbi:ATP-binding protein [Vibrio sp. TRT 17S01]|uniref:ATP-binding protein n=1 Tax=Vibrio sp. TRT 17S01 TaxID=3418505 RepID=UPI003CE8AA7F